MNEDHHFFFRLGYISIAAIAGAITALSFTPWQDKSRLEVFLTLISGFSFAVFVAPWAASEFFDIHMDNNIRGLVATVYLFGAGSNILLPLAIRWIGRVIGNNGGKDAA